MSAQPQEDTLYRLQRISIRKRWIETFVRITHDGAVKENLKTELRHLNEEERQLLGLSLQLVKNAYPHDSATGYCGGCRRAWKDDHIADPCPDCGHLHSQISACPPIRRIS